ncbi:DUF262 domain-containing protein [Micromonospora sp. NBC_01405]|uniref:DUF262 domain-containing protein n=1 Tax=Micromonospora sp. NBC_01405 TaxID=2903589 RepID=UPI00324833B7
MVDIESVEAQLNAERRKVDVATHNFSVRELTRMMSDEELNVAPEYQRKFRWTEAGESAFIESVFLGLPIPPIFVATNVGFQWEVVDGLQRLSTLMHFMAECPEDLAIINRIAPLRLTGLEKLSELNGKLADDLPKSLRVYFGRQPLQVVSLTDKSDLQVRFDVFERLNKGAVALTAQEVRACVYRGDFNAFLEELSGNADLAALLRLQDVKKHDGTKAEQVLKFFAYRERRAAFDGRVEHFLNTYMEDATQAFEYEKSRREFAESTAKLRELCSGGPFLRSDYGVTPLVQFEGCLVAVADLLNDKVPIVQPAGKWLDDIELKRASMGGSNTRAALARRIDRAKALLSGTA